MLGNNDHDVVGLLAAAEGHGFGFEPEVLRAELDGGAPWPCTIPITRFPMSSTGLASCFMGTPTVVGPTRVEIVWVFSSGECAGGLAGGNSIGLIDTATLAAEFLRF